MTLLLWIADRCVVRAATVTKMTTATTQIAIARIDGASSRCREALALITAVMTSANTPTGWTTVIGARASAPSWQTIARITMRVPSSHCRFEASRSICLTASPPLPSPRDPAALTPRC